MNPPPASVSVPRVTAHGEASAPRRTHPRSFLASGITSLPGAILPLAALAFSTRGDRAPLEVLLPAALVIFALIFGMEYWRWLRTTYRIGTSDIRLESGILARAARSVPFDRIQDVSLEQALVPRLLGLTEVRLETGAGEKDELKLAYVDLREGERLRELVRERRESAGGRTEQTAAPPPEHVLFAMQPRRVLQLGLFQFSLVVVALVAGAAQQFDFLLPFDPYDLAEWQEVLAGPGAWLAGMGSSARMIGAVLAGAALIVVGVVSGLLRTIMREWGFTLTRNAKGFRRRRGLLTRTDVAMPVHRVQAVAIGTGWIRYRFGWHEAAFISLGGDGGGSGNHVVAPLARWEELAPVVAEAGFAVPPADLAWHRLVPAWAFVEGARSAARWLLITGVAAAVQAIALPPGIWRDPLWLILPLGIGLVRAAWTWFELRHQRWALDGDLLYHAGGRLAPFLTIANSEKLHSAEIARGPLARRLGYARLQLGLAGGGFAISALAPADALALRAALLDSMTSRDFSAVV